MDADGFPRVLNMDDFIAKDRCGRRLANMVHWRYDKELNTLNQVEDGVETGYEIDLDECQTCAGLLDWIFQITGKVWVTPGALSEMLWAFMIILKPQARMCSGGIDKTAKK